MVTPTRIIVTREPGLSNFVMRNYKYMVKNELRKLDTDRYLRVSFVDENFEQLNYRDLHETSQDILKRIQQFIRNGITVCRRKFHFLAYSSSQLRSSSYWAVAHDPKKILDWLSCDKFCSVATVSKRGARMGQLLSSTRFAIDIKPEFVKCISDLSAFSSEDRCRYNYSDGNGLISTKAMIRISKELNWPDIPSVVQFRRGGAKGTPSYQLNV